MAGMLQQPSQDDIKKWFSANQGATDLDISNAMKQFGVGTANIAQATGVNHREVQYRHAKATGNTLLAQMTAPQQAAIYRPPPAAPAPTLGTAWTPDMMNANSSAAEISGTYSNWAKQNGGDTDANRATANQFLLGKGLSQNSINGAYDQFKGAGMLAQNAQAAGPTAGPRFSDQDVQSWFSQNPNASDQDIAQAMQKFGVGMEQVGRVTGVGTASTLARFNQAIGKTGAGTGAGGGAPGAGGAAGAPPFGGMTASQSAMTGITQAPIPKDVTVRAVNQPKELIEGRIQGLLGADANGNYQNPVVQQAAQMAMQQFASRGLLNSSMAVQAASQAAISKAIEIAGPDAQTMFSQGRANQDSLNVFARDKIGNDFTASQQDKLFGQQDKELAQRASQFDREFGQKGQELALRASQFDVNTGLEKDKATALVTSAALGKTHEASIRNIDAVNRQFEMYTNSTFQIDQNKDMSEEAKVAAKNDAGANFDTFARNANVVWATLGGRFSVAAPAPAPARNFREFLYQSNPSDGP